LNPALVLITDQDIQKLSIENIIFRDKKGNLVVNYEFIKKEDKNKPEDKIYNEVKNRIQEYRNLWKGLFTGSMGTPTACVDKLTEWLINNPQYSFDDVLTASEYWIENKLSEVRNPSLLGQADYFIYKNVDGNKMSRLSSIIEEALENRNQPFEKLI